MAFNVLSLYMHEMALHSQGERIRPGFSTESLRDGLVNQEALSATHISALSACLSAIDGIVDTFLSMDVFSIRCLPVFNFVRVAYAVVILIKMYFSAAAPGSELGRVFDRENMRVEQRLDALLDKFRATAADDRSRPAAKFLVVLVMLRSWFYKQMKSEGTGKDSSATPQGPSNAEPAGPKVGLSQQPQAHFSSCDHPQTANTPLQLLSEVATGSGASNDNGNGNPRGMTRSFGGIIGIRQPPQPYFHDPTPVGESPSDNNNNNNSNDDVAATTPASAMANTALPGPTPFYDTISPDVAAAMAPGIPVFPNNGPGSFAPDVDFGLNAPAFDLEGMGLGFDTQDAYENGVRIVMNEPWFSDMFQSMPGPVNMFNF